MAAMAEKKPPSFTLNLSRWRRWVQGAFLLVWLNPFVALHNFCGPVFHCYSCPLSMFACPIGVMANFSALHVFPFAAIGVIVLVAVLVGSFVCGWLCPFGLFQDIAGKIPTPKYQLPRWSGYLRYVVLVGLVLVIPFLFGEGHPLFICRVCPAGALEGAVPAMIKAAAAGESVSWPSVAKIVITSVFLVGIVFTDRPWCRLFCPLGAIYGLFNKGALLFLRFRKDRCIDCGLCREVCRYGVKPDLDAGDSRCIRCLDCAVCPTDALEATSAASRRHTAPESAKAESRVENQ